MSVLIKDMEMPKVCYECWALDDDYDYPRCRITEEMRGYTFRTREIRMDKCPLAEVKEPHDFAPTVIKAEGGDEKRETLNENCKIKK